MSRRSLVIGAEPGGCYRRRGRARSGCVNFGAPNIRRGVRALSRGRIAVARVMVFPSHREGLPGTLCRKVSWAVRSLRAGASRGQFACACSG
jgi:hypothetical protein